MCVCVFGVVGVNRIETKYRLRFHFNEILIASVIISAFTFHSISESLLAAASNSNHTNFSEKCLLIFSAQPPSDRMNGRMLWCKVAVFLSVNCEYVEVELPRKKGEKNVAKQMKCVTEGRTRVGQMQEM